NNGVLTSEEISRSVLFQASPESSIVPVPPAFTAQTGAPFGPQPSTTPPPATGVGTRRQWVIRSGFHVPQRQSSLPLAGSCPVRQSPPAMSSSVRPLNVKGIGLA